MKKNYLLIALFLFTQLSMNAQNLKNNANNKELITYGKALLESLKETESDNFFTSFLLLSEFKQTVYEQTEEINRKIFLGDSRNDNDEMFKNWSDRNFGTIKSSNSIKWQDAKYIEFLFNENIERSKLLGFKTGTGSLFFNVSEQEYELKIFEVTKLLSGWKGMGYKLETYYRRNEELDVFGKAVLNSFKFAQSGKLLEQGLMITEFKKTIKAKTSVDFKNNFLNEVAKESDKKMQAMINRDFEKIKQDKSINWKNTEFVSFVFEKEEARSSNLNFPWGPGFLSFTVENKVYSLKISEMTYLLSGWKAHGFNLSKIGHYTLESYGKTLFESFKYQDLANLQELVLSTKDLLFTVQEKTLIENSKVKFFMDIPFFEKMSAKVKERTEEEFLEITENNQINWENAEFIDFKFIENKPEIEEININSGLGILNFKADNQQYEIKVKQFFELINGWQGSRFKIDKVDN